MGGFCNKAKMLLTGAGPGWLALGDLAGEGGCQELGKRDELWAQQGLQRAGFAVELLTQPWRRTGDRRAQSLPGQSVLGPQLCLPGQAIKKLSCFKKKWGLYLTSCSTSGRVVQATVRVLIKLPKGVGLVRSSSPELGDARCLPEGWVSPGDALALLAPEAPAVLAQRLAEVSPLTCSQGRAHSITPPQIIP